MPTVLARWPGSNRGECGRRCRRSHGMRPDARAAPILKALRHAQATRHRPLPCLQTESDARDELLLCGCSALVLAVEAVEASRVHLSGKARGSAASGKGLEAQVSGTGPG